MESISRWDSPCRQFSCELFDTNRRDYMGKYELAYEFKHNGETIFKGDQYFCSPMHSIDSPEAMQGILTYLSLRPGDTDEGYFEEYTARQLEFVQQYGEELSLYCLDGEPLDGLFQQIDIEF